MDIKAINRRVIEQFRAGGEIEGMHRDRLLLLTTVGAKSGRPHTTPMMFHKEDGKLLVVASNAGAPTHPDWYRNLVANPEVTVEIGEEKYVAVARSAEGSEREELWAALKAAYPFFAEHEAKAERTIPVVVLTRQSGV